MYDNAHQMSYWHQTAVNSADMVYREMKCKFWYHKYQLIIVANCIALEPESDCWHTNEYI